MSSRKVWLVVWFVVAWLLALSMIGLLEYLVVNPEYDENTGGHFLNLLSIILAAVGLITVPIGATAICRARGHQWQPSLVVGGGAGLVYSVGVLLVSYAMIALVGDFS